MLYTHEKDDFHARALEDFDRLLHSTVRGAQL